MWPCYCARVPKLAHYLDIKFLLPPAGFVLTAPNMFHYAVIVQWGTPGLSMYNSCSTSQNILSYNASSVHKFVSNLFFFSVVSSALIDSVKALPGSFSLWHWWSKPYCTLTVLVECMLYQCIPGHTL